MGCPHHRSFTDILPSPHRRSFSQEWEHKTEEVERQAKNTQESTTICYNAHAQPLSEIGIGSNVAIQKAVGYL